MFILGFLTGILLCILIVLIELLLHKGNSSVIKEIDKVIPNKKGEILDPTTNEERLDEILYG